MSFECTDVTDSVCRIISICQTSSHKVVTLGFSLSHLGTYWHWVVRCASNYGLHLIGLEMSAFIRFSSFSRTGLSISVVRHYYCWHSLDNASVRRIILSIVTSYRLTTGNVEERRAGAYNRTATSTVSATRSIGIKLESARRQRTKHAFAYFVDCVRSVTTNKKVAVDTENLKRHKEPD